MDSAGSIFAIEFILPGAFLQNHARLPAMFANKETYSVTYTARVIERAWGCSTFSAADFHLSRRENECKIQYCHLASIPLCGWVGASLRKTYVHNLRRK